MRQPLFADPEAGRNAAPARIPAGRKPFGQPVRMGRMTAGAEAA